MICASYTHIGTTKRGPRRCVVNRDSMGCCATSMRRTEETRSRWYVDIATGRDIRGDAEHGPGDRAAATDHAHAASRGLQGRPLHGGSTVRGIFTTMAIDRQDEERKGVRLFGGPLSDPNDEDGATR